MKEQSNDQYWDNTDNNVYVAYVHQSHVHCVMIQTTRNMKQASKAPRKFKVIEISALDELSLSEGEDIIAKSDLDRVFHLAVVTFPTVCDAIQSIRYDVLSAWAQNLVITSIIKEMMKPS